MRSGGAATLIAAVVLLTMLLPFYLVRRARYRRLYGDFDPWNLPTIRMSEAEPQMRTGDLLFLRRPHQPKLFRHVAISPFTHGAVVIMQPELGGDPSKPVPHMAEVTGLYSYLAPADVLMKYPREDRWGTTILPLRVRMGAYPGGVYWCPMSPSLSDAQAQKLARAADNGSRFYWPTLYEMVGKTNYHCFEYVIHLLREAGVVCDGACDGASGVNTPNAPSSDTRKTIDDVFEGPTRLAQAALGIQPFLCSPYSLSPPQRLVTTES